MWQILQALGIFKASVAAGVTKWKVWLRRLTSAIVCSIFGNVARDALISGAARPMMGMLRDRRRERAVGRSRTVAVEAKRAGGFS